MNTSPQNILVGIDVGSTTVKAVALDGDTHETLCSTYRRHHAHQLKTARTVLDDLAAQLGDAPVHLAVTGSGGRDLADAIGVPYVQEVVANSIAVAADYPRTRVAIELGGQDAKMIFFEPEAPMQSPEAQDSVAQEPEAQEPESDSDQQGSLKVADMRMNGSCAGGTGAFLDEIASLLQIPVEQFNDFASRGKTVYSISGRCGVFAKTDIQPLINQGVAKEDIALSTFHAVAKQTLGGLAQGLEVLPPIIFEGGPLTFNPTLVRVFAERLGLSDADIIVPDRPETIVARGAALSLERLFAKREDKAGDAADADGAVNPSDASGADGASDVDDDAITLRQMQDAITAYEAQERVNPSAAPPLFESDEELAAFRERHALRPEPEGPAAFERGTTVGAYLGIDSGSTTTKFALVDESGHLLDSFYASNQGEPLDIAKEALCDMDQRWRDAGVNLDILGCCTTGYGELLFASAFHADCHVVETVAHALAAARYVEDATFILDIGGQDMKAIWIDGGIVTNILVNEACSSGCGSFLESFARTLGYKTTEIADAAFSSKSPAALGSRCTVFMTSSVVTEQKNGKSPEDIMAGLCRSIIQNVFTKVIRVPNLDALGPRIVVQGGTFSNDAVLAAFEEYVGRQVTRAPYPGLMGAVGAALFAQRHASEVSVESESRLRSFFIGFDAIRELSFTQRSNVACPFCTNNCNRTVVEFSDGTTWVTGNRCERGEVVGDPRDAAVREKVSAAQARRRDIPNVFEVRQRLLLRDYPTPQLSESRGITVGLPRVLAFWDTMPFWTTFWRALGFDVRISRPSTRAMYESGLPAVASDTICFPAKLVHGHVRDLERSRVDRIFLPSITTVPSENTESTSESMCAVVKGYGIVMRNSDNPELRCNATLDAPLFHWYSTNDRKRQLGKWMQETFGIEPSLTRKAIKAADQAMETFRTELVDAGREAMETARRKGTYAVVLASRPYHNDPLVNHDLPNMFCQLGVPVLPPDAMPGIGKVDLSQSRLDIVNNYHARMLASAILCAQDPCLEYAQIVSFGCGHDAYLTDEIIRLMRETGDKSPLVLKVDESDVAGPLRIRVRSFVETVQIKRQEHRTASLKPLSDPYPVKYTKSDRREKVVLVPNTSHAFARMMAAVFSKQGARAVPMPIGREEAIRLGKQYVHNDICFPAQITIGECLAELRSGKYDDCDVAVATGKYIGDCRLTHYGALLRKALDDAGYSHVPIITNDDVDYHDLHPGFKLSVASAARITMALPMIDALEELLRKMRPYELVPGSADAAFEEALDAVMDGLERHGSHGAQRGFKRAINIMRRVEYDRSQLRPRVLIVGEYLLNFHPGANHDVEAYLEDNGFEIIEAKMTDVIQKTYFYRGAQIREYGVRKPIAESTWYATANAMFEHAHEVCDRIASAHPLYEPACRMSDLVVDSDPIIHHTFDAGEGVLIPGEIIHHADRGCEAFVILQPFGCLPNHIVGRGIVKRLRELYPSAQILSLDYDPDVSFANVENRLQMLVMNARANRVAAEDADETTSVSLQTVEDSVSDIAAQVNGILDRVFELVQGLAAPDGQDRPFTKEHVESIIDSMRHDLDREDALAAQARAALQNARAAAMAQADESSKQVIASASRAYDLARKLRSRTNQALSDLAGFSAQLSEDGGETVAKVQQAFAARIAEIHIAVERIRAEADAIDPHE